MLVQNGPPNQAIESDRPRRILLVVHGYPPHQTNGGEVHAWTVVLPPAFALKPNREMQARLAELDELDTVARVG